MTHGDIQVACVIEPNYGENAYVVWRRDGGACWVIDPGLPPSADDIRRLIAKHRLQPAALILTHGHADHIAGVPAILAAFPGLPVHVSAGEAPLLADARQNLSAWTGIGFAVEAPVQRDLPAGGELSLEGATWRILDVSGHSPDARALHCADARVVIVGDALFAGSIGRTDFPHSRHDRLIRNIREQLFSLPDDTTVYSGHGPPTTIGEERRSNPFVGDAALGAIG